MKKLSILAIGALMMTACSSSESTKVDTSKPTELATSLDSVSYLLGYNFATDVKDNAGLKELDRKSFLTGIQRVFEDKESEFTDEDANAFMRAYFTKLRDAKGAEELVKSEEFLASNKEADGVKVTESGLQYKVLKEGDGPIPTLGAQVKVHYTGKFIDGKVFDSSVERGEPAVFKTTGVIKGWTEALSMMPVGSKWELAIPSELAYGKNGQRGIPGNAALIFEVELLDIIPEVEGLLETLK